MVVKIWLGRELWHVEVENACRLRSWNCSSLQGLTVLPLVFKPRMSESKFLHVLCWNLWWVVPNSPSRYLRFWVNVFCLIAVCFHFSDRESEDVQFLIFFRRLEWIWNAHASIKDVCASFSKGVGNTLWLLGVSLHISIVSFGECNLVWRLVLGTASIHPVPNQSRTLQDYDRTWLWWQLISNWGTPCTLPLTFWP